MCSSDGNKNKIYLDDKPKNAVKWINTSIKDIEKEYGDLINPEYYTRYLNSMYVKCSYNPQKNYGT